MANEIDLWPANIAPKIVRTPVKILDEQAALLKGKTYGRLEAEVRGETKQDQIMLHFMLNAPRLSYSARLLICSYSPELPYPVYISSEYASEHAHDQDQFMRLLSKIFASEGVRATIQSLLARTIEEELKSG